MTPNSQSHANNDRLEIFTLGRFLIRYGSNDFSDQASRSHKLWHLFKYLITNREKSIPPEVILEALWPEQEYSDPKHALRTPIYRLRQILSESSNSNAGDSFILFSQGCYKWNTGANYWLDVEEFEVLCNKGKSMAEINPSEAVDLLKRAIELYKGEYLAECLYSEWASTVRNYYRRIYLHSVLLLVRLLNKMGRQSEIIPLCESVFLVESTEEDIHISFLKALIAEGRKKEAFDHYVYVTSFFYKEFGIKPSAEMRKINSLLKDDGEYVGLNLSVIQDSFQVMNDSSNAYFCDRDVFGHLYELERRRIERSGQAVFLGLITLSYAGHKKTSLEYLKDEADKLVPQLLTSLRKGDVFTRLNDLQFLLLLPGSSLENGKVIMKRITKEYSKTSSEDVILQGEFRTLLPPVSKLTFN